MAENKQFETSEQLDCSDCVNHGGDWDCDHVQCRKGTDTVSRARAIETVRKAKSIGQAHRMLVQLPSAQPDIVVCGDCIHWICHDRRCGYWNHGVKPLDWCCHAERRTDG